MYHRQLKNRSEQQSDHLVRGHFQQYRDEIQDLFYFIRNQSKLVCAFFPHSPWMTHLQMQVSEADLSHPQFAQAWISLIHPALAQRKKGAKIMLTVLEDMRLRNIVGT